MKLYVNGCSFSHGHKDFKIKDGVSDISPDWAWPMLMKEHFDEVVSEAYRGSSNHRIIRRSIEYLNTIDNPEEWTVVIQFANIERQEYYDEDLKCWIGHIVDDPCIDDKASPIGNDELNNKLNYKAFKNYCTLVNNQKSVITDLVLQVMAFQGFCKIKGFKNVFYTGQSNQTMLSYYLQNQILDGLAHNIDTLNFLLPISNVTRGYEESPTDGHPNEAGHELFARYIINEIQK